MMEITKYNITKTKSKIIMLMTLNLCCVVILGMIMKNIDIIQEKDSAISAVSHNNEYRLTNSMTVSGSITGYFSDLSKLSNLKNFYLELSDNTNYTYLDKTCQGIYMENNLGTNIFLYGYEKGSENYYSDEQNINYYNFKNVTINNNCWLYYNFKVIKGRCFEENDYYYNDTIPVILGYEYKDYYDIGDIFQGEYLSCEFKYKVVGILEKDSIINIQNEILFLDRYIISPSVVVPELPNNKNELFYQSASYLQKIRGSIVLSENFSLPDLNYKLENLKNTYGMFELFIINEDPYKAVFYQFACYSGKNTLIILEIIVTIILIIMEICVLFDIFDGLAYFWGICLVNGASTRTMLVSITLFYSFIIAISCTTGVFFLYINNFLTVKFLFYFLIFYVGFDIIAFIITKQMLEQNIDDIIRRH